MRIIRTTTGWNKKLFQCFGCSKGSYSQCKKPVAEIRAPARRCDSCFERSSYFSSCGSFFVLSIGVVRNVWVMEISVPFAASGPWSCLLAAIDAIYWSTCQCDFDPCSSCKQTRGKFWGSRDDCRARYAFNPSRPGHDAKQWFEKNKILKGRCVAMFCKIF